MRLVAIAVLFLAGGAVGRLNNCEHCRHIARDVFKGLAATEGGHFGGGNSAWEADRLGAYKTSETRFMEVMERPCADRAYDCLKVLEDAEEHLEQWWKTRAEAATESDLVTQLCIEGLKLCCPAGHAGRDCKPCPVSANLVCGGHGKCRGDGHRSGAGTCQCVSGYKGPACDACRSGFFARVEGPPRTCEPCHTACNKSCTGPTPADCTVCAPGYARATAEAAGAPAPCQDIDECAASASASASASACAAGFACTNTAGSFTCVQAPSETDAAAADATAAPAPAPATRSEEL